MEIVYPMLLIPKECVKLHHNAALLDDIILDITITSPNTKGEAISIYTGCCHIKFTDKEYNTPNKSTQGLEFINIEDAKSVQDAAVQSTYPSNVWIDPARSPYIYNNYTANGLPPQHFVYNHQANHVTVQQHNTYITQNVYSYPETIHYASSEEYGFETLINQNNVTDLTHLFDGDELEECGLLLEEITCEKEPPILTESIDLGLQSDNNALKQLMSNGIQIPSKPQKTIIFMGPECGQTIQKIAVNDPFLMCTSDDNIASNIVDIENNNNSNQKKYQCEKCEKIFDQITAFKQHMVVSHERNKIHHGSECDNELKVFICAQCGKKLKSQEKFELHSRGHGDPDLECEKCNKVFASKFSLRTHRKIHTRKYPCANCTKSFNKLAELRTHLAKTHPSQKCDDCDFTTNNQTDLQKHEKCHIWRESTENSESFFLDDGVSDIENDSDSGNIYELPMDVDENDSIEIDIKNANDVLAKVMSNKSCDVCSKTFTRIGDLKRHLIEHVIKSTLAKNPVSKDGTLNIQCEVCQVQSFTKVDKYKAHLREHAKLTLYQCTFCNKSFSDSSNFSKHKKIHGTAYYQCDLCLRKFNSKKMLTKHMQYHKENTPLPCRYCDKTFHFESMLNKHIKSTHNKAAGTRFRCNFCQAYYKTLKEKWDHEWYIHNVRKVKIDCGICSRKFRKYAELKRHCLDNHDLEIPPAKMFLQQQQDEKYQI
ncbi:Zinc finger protein 112 [Papilio machaon]|uniref:Zinc finger protein 112 n=1 Tax=Papilio machaon TaxID=76193 RepID=A0A0N1PH50_PAPMA|nr:Zinc finger protein 112 [Papilio machaon]